jgi:hypothetical protein
MTPTDEPIYMYTIDQAEDDGILVQTSTLLPEHGHSTASSETRRPQDGPFSGKPVGCNRMRCTSTEIAGGGAKTHAY